MKIAIITWASSWLWKAFLELITQRKDIDEIWALARDKKRLENLKKEFWTKIKPYSIDISDKNQILKFSKYLAKEKPNIKFLVNNAWYGKFWAYDDLNIEDSINMIDLNISGVVAMWLVCIPYMKKNSHIINISSVASFQPLPYLNIYAATKSFVKNYSRALNVELKSKWIKVTAVCPSWIQTNFFKRWEIWAKIAPRKYDYIVTPEFVANKAIKDSLKWKDISIPWAYAKFLHIASSILPDKWIMKWWIKQQNME